MHPNVSRSVKTYGKITDDKVRKQKFEGNRESFQNERIIVHFMINYPYINFLFFLHINTSTTGKPAKSCTMNSIAQFTLLNNTTETTKTFKNE